jgi:endo-1,4-beta-mannosidase
MTLGGMDLYVQQFGLQTHDQFYTDSSILTSFLNYTTQVVSRYVNSPAVFSYELANDPRYVMACLAELLSLMHFYPDATLPYQRLLPARQKRSRPGMRR